MERSSAGFPCFPQGLCLEQPKPGWVLVLPHLAPLCFGLGRAGPVLARVIPSTACNPASKGFQPGNTAPPPLLYSLFSLQSARDALGFTGIPPGTP